MTTRVPKNYYLVPVFGCVEPENLEEGFDTYHELLEAARKWNQSGEYSLFYIYMDDGIPKMGFFFSGEMEGNEDCPEDDDDFE